MSISPYVSFYAWHSLSFLDNQFDDVYVVNYFVFILNNQDEESSLKLLYSKMVKIQMT